MTLSPGNGNIIITDTMYVYIIETEKTVCYIKQNKSSLTVEIKMQSYGFMVKTATIKTATNSTMMKFIRRHTLHTGRTQ